MENREQLKTTSVTQSDFLTALSKISKSVGKDDLLRYQEWMQEFGSA